MYRIAVCDDEPLAAKTVTDMTRRILEGRNMVYSRDFGIDIYHTAAALLDHLKRHQHAYQLLLLDVKLDEANGVELARFLRKHRVAASIIYITGYPDFALDSFSTYPLEYLLKPIDEGRLAAALDWDWRQRHQRPKRPLFRTGQWAIPLEDILYLEISGRKTTIHTLREDISHPESLSKAEGPLLEQGFCHSHYSFLVNLAHIDHIERTFVALDSGATLPVSRRYYQQLMNRHIESLK